MKKQKSNSRREAKKRNSLSIVSYSATRGEPFRAVEMRFHTCRKKGIATYIFVNGTFSNDKNH